MNIDFRYFLYGKDQLLRLVPDQVKQCLTLYALEDLETQKWKFLGDISMENLIQITNFSKLRCKYGHPVEVAKRKRRQRL